MVKLGKVEAKGRAWLSRTIRNRDNRGRTRTLAASRTYMSCSVLIHPPLPGGPAPTATSEKRHE